MSIYYKELPKIPTTKAYYKAWDYLQKAVQMFNRAEYNSEQAGLEAEKLSKLIIAITSLLEPVRSDNTVSSIDVTWNTLGGDVQTMTIHDPRLDTDPDFLPESMPSDIV